MNLDLKLKLLKKAILQAKTKEDFMLCENVLLKLEKDINLLENLSSKTKRIISYSTYENSDFKRLCKN